MGCCVGESKHTPSRNLPNLGLFARDRETHCVGRVGCVLVLLEALGRVRLGGLYAAVDGDDRVGGVRRLLLLKDVYVGARDEVTIIKSGVVSVEELPTVSHQQVFWRNFEGLTDAGFEFSQEAGTRNDELAGLRRNLSCLDEDGEQLMGVLLFLGEIDEVQNGCF